MSNPTSVGLTDHKPAVLLASTAEASVTLSNHKRYRLFHDGEDGTGTACTVAIYLRCDADTVVATAAEGANKAKLLATRNLTIGPGVKTLYFKMASVDCTFTIVPEEFLGDI